MNKLSFGTQSQARPARFAFTLIELLVVMAIIGALMGLLMPAVQAVRESARRTECQSRLRQIATAALNYESTFQSLPPGVDPESGLSWLALLMPFHEQRALWDSIWEEADLGYWFVDLTAYRTPVQLYVCPSDGRPAASHIANDGLAAAFTDYLGALGTNQTLNDGVLVNRNLGVHEIRDGQSNTLLCGERPPDQLFSAGRYLVGGAIQNILGLREVNLYPDTSTPAGPFEFKPGRIDISADKFHYWSFHPGGANFACVDGSVKFYPYPAKDLLVQMATRAGGEVLRHD